MTVGLVDANNFYVSCERAFNPKLKNIPVVVLSNNDGCVISRSQEAKDMKIEMGAPWFRLEAWAKKNGVRAISSNYPLYGDMSRRIYEVLQEYSPVVEPYSIDEMFIDLTGIANVTRDCQTIRSSVLRKTKIPTCIGIGETKTKAKLANHLAKIRSEFQGVCSLQSKELCERFYPEISIDRVWGIGAGSAKKLKSLGYTTVDRLMSLDQHLARKLLTVTGARIVMELRGVLCLPLSTATPVRKGVAVSRTFGKAVTDLRNFCSALSTFVPILSEKLRRQQLMATSLTVFATTNRFAEEKYREGSVTFDILPMNDTLSLNREVLKAARSIWQDGHRYSRAGIYVQQVRPAEYRLDDTNSCTDRADPERLMEALEFITQRYGRNSIRTAAMKLKVKKKKEDPTVLEEWDPRLNLNSSAYTTCVDELMQVKA